MMTHQHRLNRRCVTRSQQVSAAPGVLSCCGVDLLPLAASAVQKRSQIRPALRRALVFVFFFGCLLDCFLVLPQPTLSASEACFCAATARTVSRECADLLGYTGIACVREHRSRPAVFKGADILYCADIL